MGGIDIIMIHIPIQTLTYCIVVVIFYFFNIVLECFLDLWSLWSLLMGD